jgi:TonB-dependent SusC/RagA subfamily outer membrane receptor
MLVVLSADLFAQTPMPQRSYKTIFEMLKDVPGLEVRTTNDKSGGSVIVRGTGSLTKQPAPLFVVDGNIYSGDITSINPQDVDYINVLKDAASTSTYGAQGAGGVIQITTKKGTGVTNNVVVASHNESAYTYFIEHKTPLKVFGLNDEVLIEGVIQKQQDSVLVFSKKKKEILIPIKNIKRVEMIPQ